MIKGIIFDYGGTIDSRGIHWSEVIWGGYQAAGVPVTKEQFRDSYVHAERERARAPHPPQRQLPRPLAQENAHRVARSRRQGAR